jgi:hypothetical protein
MSHAAAANSWLAIAARDGKLVHDLGDIAVGRIQPGGSPTPTKSLPRQCSA